MNRLHNKVALITGAAGGIGKAIAQLFLQEGAKVWATDIQEEVLLDWVQDMQKEGYAIEAAAHDVSREEDWNDIVGKVIQQFGRLDILVNNAGVFPPGSTTENTSLADWQKIISIDLTGPFIGSRLCAPLLKQNGGGSIIHISSIAGLVGGNGPAYSSAKAGLCMLSKDQAVEFAKYNIRVNAILPGGVKTPMTEFLTHDPAADELMKNLCPLGRIGLATEIANGALYLASDEASYTTGTELVIDGGLTAR